MVNKLPLLALAGCLQTDYEVDVSKCEPQIQELEQACKERNGLVKATADKVKECLGEDVKIICSWGDVTEADMLSITPNHK